MLNPIFLQMLLQFELLFLSTIVIEVSLLRSLVEEVILVQDMLLLEQGFMALGVSHTFGDHSLLYTQYIRINDPLIFSQPIQQSMIVGPALVLRINRVQYRRRCILVVWFLSFYIFQWNLIGLLNGDTCLRNIDTGLKLP